MSSSSDHASPFSIQSDPGVLITIFDAAGVKLHRAHRAVELSLPSGLYRVQLQRTGRIATHVAIHRGDTSLQFPGPPLETPIPIRGAASSHDYYTDAAVELSTRDTCAALGPPPHDSRLFLFVRRQASPDRELPVPSELITIHDVAGHRLARMCPLTSRVDRQTGYVAFSGMMAPGSYRVRAARSRRDVAISIPAHRAAYVFAADHDAVRLDDLRVSIVPIGAAFDPASPIAAAMECVLAALRGNAREIPDLARALWPDGAEADLAFGIASAYLLRRAGDTAMFDAVMARLMPYADELPDVAILDHARRVAADAPRALRLATPPLLRASVVLATHEDDAANVAVEPYSAFERAAATAYHDSVWCTWSDRPWDARWIAPTTASLRARGDRSPASIARAIALPLRTVERTITRLDATLPSLHGAPIQPDEVRVPGYVVGELLGRGSQGSVFRAIRERDGRAVALKVLPWLGDAELRRRAVREIEIMKRFRHPRILQLEDHGELPDGGGLWLELELCAGSVEDALADRVAPLPAERACRIVLQALEGLAYIHDTRTVHCDLKPGNLLLRADGSAAIADFGIAKQLGRTSRSPGAPGGTARFAPPEQLDPSGHTSPAADVWSMAATLYFMLTLELPRDEYAGQDEVQAAVSNPAVPIAERWPAAPRPLAACIDRALSADPRMRPSNGGMLRSALFAALEASTQDAVRGLPIGAAGSPATLGIRHALVIGVQISGLGGTEHDARRVRAMLESRGFEVDSRLGADATRAGILDGYDRLIARSEPGDTVVIYYSGTGRCATLGDERWCLIGPSDLHDGDADDWRGITTWELSIKEAELTRKTRNVSVVMDCCFSPVTSRDSEANQASAKTDATSSFMRGFPAHLAALERQYGAPVPEDQRAYNPDVIRLLASAADGTAYEYRGDDGQIRGAFTEALLDVLAGIGDSAVSWRVIAELVRSRVSSRFLTQHPVLEGPGDRIPFSLVEHADTDALAVEAAGDALVIGGGSLTSGLLNQVTVGEIYAVLPTAQARFERAGSLGEIEITEVGTVTSRARWLDRRAALPEGAVAVPITRHAARSPLTIAVPEDARALVLRAVYASGILRVAEPSDASPVATLRVAAGAVTIEDSWGELCAPRPFPGGLDAMIARAGALAIARQLREMEGEHGVFESEFEVELGLAGRSTQVPALGATVRLDDRLHVRVTSATHRRLYAHVLGINVRGDIELRSRRVPTRLEPGAPGGVPDEVFLELTLVWPDDLPRDYPRPEEIVVVVSTELADLGGLETPIEIPIDAPELPSLPPSSELRGSAPAAGSKLDLLAQLRDRGIRNLEAGEPEWPFCIKRISYLLDPAPAPDEAPCAAAHGPAIPNLPVPPGADPQGELTR